LVFFSFIDAVITGISVADATTTVIATVITGISVTDATTTVIATTATIIGLIATVYKNFLTGRIGVGYGGIYFCATGS